MIFLLVQTKRLKCKCYKKCNKVCDLSYKLPVKCLYFLGRFFPHSQVISHLANRDIGHGNDDMRMMTCTMNMARLSECWNQSWTWTATTGRRSPSKRKKKMPFYNLEGYVGWWRRSTPNIRKSGRWNRTNLCS